MKITAEITESEIETAIRQTIEWHFPNHRITNISYSSYSGAKITLEDVPPPEPSTKKLRDVLPEFLSGPPNGWETADEGGESPSIADVRRHYSTD